MRSTTGASGSGCSGFAISCPSSFASSICLRFCRYSLVSSSGSNSPTRLSMTCCASPSSASFTSLLETASSISAWELTSSARNIVSSASASPFGRIRQRCSAPWRTNRPSAAFPRLLHGAQQKHVRSLRRSLSRRREVVRSVEVDGIDFGRVHEARDLDRLRVVDLHDRLEIGLFDDDELALGHLPALDDLVAPDLAVVHLAPALLLDRSHALTVQLAERHVRLTGGGLRRKREPDRDVDQPKADGAVPDRAHEENQLYLDRSFPPATVP